MTRAKPIDDVRAIISIAKLIARRMYKEKMRREGRRISLTPVNLGAMHNQLLAERGAEIYAEARREWERLKPMFAPEPKANPRRTRKDRPRDVGAQGAVEAKPV
jgi:hypothetical protein